MPSLVSTAATTVSTGAIDNRDQPWKKILAAANYTKTASSAPDEEIVKTGGPCDVLTNFFSAWGRIYLRSYSKPGLDLDDNLRMEIELSLRLLAMEN